MTFYQLYNILINYEQSKNTEKKHIINQQSILKRVKLLMLFITKKCKAKQTTKQLQSQEN